MNFLFYVLDCLALEEYFFDDIDSNYRFIELIKNFKCVVCQNQSLYDSLSSFSYDLKNFVYDMIVIGESNFDIFDFFVDNYGEFISYSPLATNVNMILWILPLVFFFVGVICFILILFYKFK